MASACKTETPSKITPTVEPSSAKQLPESTNCLACSEDGRYLGLGHSRGLSVWCASSLSCAAQSLQHRMEITSVQMTRTAEAAYLLGTIDDMGVARVFAFQTDAIHLLSVINIMDNISERRICLTFEVSEGGDYGVASLSCSGDLWLEVYHFPTDAWLRKLEATRSQKQELHSSADANVKKCVAAEVIKIKPLKIQAGRAVDRPSDALQMTEFLTHCLALDEHNSGPQQSSSGTPGKTNESLRRCTHHFLLPCGQIPSDVKARSQSGLPVAVCLWWSGSTNLLQYLLRKAPKNKADMEPLPDVLWPHAEEILCTSVSRCTRYIALALHGGFVCVWDRQFGSPLSVVFAPAADSAVSRIQIVDCQPVSLDHSRNFTTTKIHLLLSCKSGALYTVTTGRGLQSFTVQLAERPKHNGHLPTVTASVPFLQSMLLVLQRDGKMLLQDAIKRSTACFLIPPTTHVIASPCSPVYALSSKQHALFIKGDEDPSCRGSSTRASQSRLFIFQLGECDIIKEFIISPPDSEPQIDTPSGDSLEETCDLYLQQRALSVDERNKAVKQSWKRLEEASIMLQKSRSAASQ